MKESNKSDSGQRTSDHRQKEYTRFIDELSNLKEQHLLRNLTSLESSSGPGIVIKGKTLINFASNDYLNLSSHPGIVRASEKALKKYGFGSGASRLLSGTHSSHKRLEERIAAFKKTESALLFNTGYAANTGIIPAVAGKGDVIFSDELNHASIIDGIKLSKANLNIYRHRDMKHLESLLKKSLKLKTVNRRLIVTDTVFSMDGGIAPLIELDKLGRKYSALLMVDDAHGTGVLGEEGRGGLEHFGLSNKGIVQMGTLGKAAGCFGAFAAGRKDLIDLLINRSRSFIYSTSLPPAVCEAGIKALEIIGSRSKGLRKRLWRNRERLSEGLNALGFNTLGSETPIIPVLIGDAESALRAGRYLFKNRIFAPAIRPPTVAEGKSRIRFSVTAAHTKEDIDLVLDVLRCKKW